VGAGLGIGHLDLALLDLPRARVERDLKELGLGLVRLEIEDDLPGLVLRERFAQFASQLLRHLEFIDLVHAEADDDRAADELAPDERVAFGSGMRSASGEGAVEIGVNGKDGVEAALRGYKEIHLRALKLLKPGGFLATFCCSHHVDGELFKRMIVEAAADAQRDLRLIQILTQSSDHPILPAVPETEYLKGFILQVVE